MSRCAKTWGRSEAMPRAYGPRTTSDDAGPLSGCGPALGMRVRSRDAGPGGPEPTRRCCLRAGAPLKRRGPGVDVGGVAGLRWLTAVAVALAGAVLAGTLAHPFVGSGTSCEGIGFGCTPERDFDTFLIVAVYVVGAAATLS